MLGNFQNPGNFCLWNLESRKRFLLESGIQLKESGISLINQSINQQIYFTIYNHTKQMLISRWGLGNHA